MRPQTPDKKSREDDTRPGPLPEQAVEVSAENLFGDAKEIVIVYQGERYRLRRTRRGGLVLTK